MNVANFITSLRILLTPLFVYLYWSQDPKLQVYGIIVFTLASLTDWFDGYYARRFNIVTRLGQFLDPLADKVLNLSATIMFAVKLYVFWWIVIAIAIRDLSVTFFRLYALSRNQPVVTSAVAKYKTALNMILIFIIMLEELLSNLDFVSLLDLSASYFNFTGILWLITAILSIYTAIVYFIDNRTLLVQMWRRILKLMRIF